MERVMDRAAGPTAKLYLLLPGRGVVEAASDGGTPAGASRPSPVAALEDRYKAVSDSGMPGRGRFALTGLGTIAAIAALGALA
jgi:hypothetical protein